MTASRNDGVYHKPRCARSEIVWLSDEFAIVFSRSEVLSEIVAFLTFSREVSGLTCCPPALFGLWLATDWETVLRSLIRAGLISNKEIYGESQQEH